MYKISEFADITGLSKETLRYYAEVKLLEPAYIDTTNNYRYYDDGSYFVAVLCYVGRIWIRICIFGNSSCIWRTDADVSLQANQDSHFRFCMEGIQGHCTLSYNNICSNRTRCSISFSSFIKKLLLIYYHIFN